MFEISTLKEKKISELQEIANELGIKKTAGIKKLDLAYKIIDHYASNPKASDKTIESKVQIRVNEFEMVSAMDGCRN